MKNELSLKILSAIENNLEKIILNYNSFELSTLVIHQFSQGKDLEICGFFMQDVYARLRYPDATLTMSVYLGNNQLDSSILDDNLKNLINNKCLIQYRKDIQRYKDL